VLEFGRQVGFRHRCLKRVGSSPSTGTFYFFQLLAERNFKNQKQFSAVTAISILF